MKCKLSKLRTQKMISMWIRACQVSKYFASCEALVIFLPAFLIFCFNFLFQNTTKSCIQNQICRHALTPNFAIWHLLKKNPWIVQQIQQILREFSSLSYFSFSLSHFLLQFFFVSHSITPNFTIWHTFPQIFANSSSNSANTARVVNA